MDYTALEQEIILEYGVCLRPRKTKSGNLVIGVGYSGPDVRPGSAISLERAGQILSAELEKSIAQVRMVLGFQVFDTIHDEARRALVRMVFSGEQGFDALTDIAEHIRVRNWVRVAGEYMNTDHAKNNPTRAEKARLAFLGVT